ncbi:MAG: hypothetical protein IKL00_09760 [Oscillospiraceae bacterium]|nr:hypothetical protein [Oscillospiraceae bacterium]
MKKVSYTIKDYLITFGILLVAVFFLVLSFTGNANLLVKLILLAFLLESLYSAVDLLAWKLAYDDHHFVTRSLFQKETAVSFDEVISASITADTRSANMMTIGRQNLMIYYRNRRLCISMGMTNAQDLARTIKEYHAMRG